MSKKHRDETEEERKERKRAKKEAKKAKKQRLSLESASSDKSTVISTTTVDSPLPTTPEARATTPTTTTDPTPTTPTTTDEHNSFRQERLRMVVSLYPVSDVLVHVRESLRSLLLKYSDGVGGVLLGFENVKLCKDKYSGATGMILNELPHVHYTVELDALVFCPKVGSKLTGVVNECFPSHVGMLVHSFFNAMVSSDHMHAAGYVFDRDLQQWMQENGSKVVANDDRVDFCIEKLHECAGVISMEGSHPSVS